MNKNFTNILKSVFEIATDKPRYDENEMSLTERYDFLLELLSNPKVILKYSDQQIADGLWNLFSLGNTDFSKVFIEESISIDSRKRLLTLIYNLYESVFSFKCTLFLSHLNEAGANSINITCYMFWDVFPILKEDMLKTFFELTEKILNLENIACQESALHGLGHYNDEDNNCVNQIIDSYLKNKNALRSEIIRYALDAKCGNIQ